MNVSLKKLFIGKLFFKKEKCWKKCWKRFLSNVRTSSTGKGYSRFND